MRGVIYTILLVFAACQAGYCLGQDQLYTGDAATVPPGQMQLQLYYVTPLTNEFTLGGTSLRFGTTGNTDVRVGYGYLWNDRGPDLQLGPNLGVKWRFMGDGRRKPSISLSGLCALSERNVTRTRRGDLGALLVLEYPTKPAIFLANLGRVWTGASSPDLRYVALAAGRFVTKRVLLAVQYVSVNEIRAGTGRADASQYIFALVYLPDKRLGYSVQFGHSPDARSAPNNLTLGLSRYF